MNVTGIRAATALLFWAVAVCAQAPLGRDAEKMAAKMFDGTVTGEKLDCDATVWPPFFDFSFRFEAGFVVHCSYRQFGGDPNTLAALVRIRPQFGMQVILGDVYGVPGVPENLRGKFNIKKFKDQLEFSGSVGVGEGDYEVELLVADSSNRFFRKHWKARAERHGSEMKAGVSMRPGEVAPLLLAKFEEPPISQADPLRLTVLLNAAPINPYSRKLRAWDRAFLLGSVTSLMRQVPKARVSLVAFNADQQKEVYRTNLLDRGSFDKLNQALRELELGTISYKTLQSSGASDQLFSRMLSQEAKSDAVVFLGPQMRQMQRPQSEACNARQPPLFYLKYFAFVGVQYSDSIDHLTRDCKGRVLGFHSPGELGAAIEKMRRSLADN